MNYFDILNVSINAESEVIKASYRTLAKKYHPDSYKGGKEEAEQKMAQINEAYQVLSDEKLKREYIERLGLGKGFESQAKESGQEKQTDDYEHEEKYSYKSTKVYRESSSNTSSDEDRYSQIVLYIILMVIVVSIICCIIHFGPGIWSEFIEDVSEQIEELKYNFSF